MAFAWGGETPPTGSQPLSEILITVEKESFGTLSDVEFDDGVWEAKVCKAGVCEKLYFNPTSGELVRRRLSEADETPQGNVKPLSEIVKLVEAKGLGTITEIEYDDGFWEVELRKDGKLNRVFVNPVSGEIN